MSSSQNSTPHSVRYSRYNRVYRLKRQTRASKVDNAAIKKMALIIMAICVALALLSLHTSRATVGANSSMNFLSIITNEMIAPKSTPQSKWHQGEVPLLYQTDKTWAAEPYGNGTIGDSGCGPVSLSMAYIALTGDASLGPVEMARFAEDGGFVFDSATKWSLMEVGAEQLGLTSEELSADANQVAAALNDGKYVIAIMGPGDFTKSGHYVVLYNPDDSGNVYVADSNSSKNSSHSWELQKVVSQAKDLWALSV